MKIVLSPGWWHQMLVLFLVEIICIMWSVFRFYEDVALMIFMCLCIFAIMTLVEGVILISMYRLLTYVINTETNYSSYLFKKKLCTIDKTKSIYYVIFTADEAVLARREFIVLSNEPFEYQQVPSIRVFRGKKPLLVSYDVKKQIAMPYDSKTIQILELEEWYSVETS